MDHLNKTIEDYVKAGLTSHLEQLALKHPTSFMPTSENKKWLGWMVSESPLKAMLGSVKVFLDAGHSPSTQDMAKRTPLHHFLIRRYKLRQEKDQANLEVLSRLAKEPAALSLGDYKGFTALHFAVMFSDLEACKMLITAGSSLDQGDETGRGALAIGLDVPYTLMPPERVELILELLKAGADVHQEQDNGLTPLHLAALRGHLDIAKMLVVEGAQIESLDHEGYSAIDYALDDGKIGVSRAYAKQTIFPEIALFLQGVLRSQKEKEALEKVCLFEKKEEILSIPNSTQSQASQTWIGKPEASPKRSRL